MNTSTKVKFFDKNLVKILNKGSHRHLLGFILDSLHNEKFLNAIKAWPDDAKIKFVDNYLNE